MSNGYWRVAQVWHKTSLRSRYSTRLSKILYGGFSYRVYIFYRFFQWSWSERFCRKLSNASSFVILCTSAKKIDVAKFCALLTDQTSGLFKNIPNVPANISDRICLGWMKFLGFHATKAFKSWVTGYYERVDIVQYRDEFLSDIGPVKIWKLFTCQS